MQNRLNVRQKDHNGSRKTTCRERGKKYRFQNGGGGIKIVFGPKYSPLLQGACGFNLGIWWEGKNIFVRNCFPDGKFSLLSYGRYSKIPLPLYLRLRYSCAFAGFQQQGALAKLERGPEQTFPRETYDRLVITRYLELLAHLIFKFLLGTVKLHQYCL